MKRAFIIGVLAGIAAAFLMEHYFSPEYLFPNWVIWVWPSSTLLASPDLVENTPRAFVICALAILLNGIAYGLVACMLQAAKLRKQVRK